MRDQKHCGNFSVKYVFYKIVIAIIFIGKTKNTRKFIKNIFKKASQLSKTHFLLEVIARTVFQKAEPLQFRNILAHGEPLYFSLPWCKLPYISFLTRKFFSVFFVYQTSMSMFRELIFWFLKIYFCLFLTILYSKNKLFDLLKNINYIFKSTRRGVLAQL